MDYTTTLQAGLANSQASGMANTQPMTLGERFDGNLNRLEQMSIRLGQTADAIHGSAPASVNQTGAATPRPISSIASRVRDLAEIIDRIEATINRLQAGL